MKTSLFLIVIIQESVIEEIRVVSLMKNQELQEILEHFQVIPDQKNLEVPMVYATHFKKENVIEELHADLVMRMAQETTTQTQTQTQTLDLQEFVMHSKKENAIVVILADFLTQMVIINNNK
jgi:hypothetical protein